VDRTVKHDKATASFPTLRRCLAADPSLARRLGALASSSKESRYGEKLFLANRDPARMTRDP